MAINKREKASGSSDGSSRGLEECGLSKNYPKLAEFCYSGTWADGTRRELGTLSLSVAEGRWRMALNDYASGEYCFVSASSLTGVFKAAEKGLLAEDLPWRESKHKRGKQSK